jgi:ferredoxin, 2Fe-2S
LLSCQAATDDEEDMLDTARAVTPESRLSCQCVPNGTMDLTVVIPAWNKNLVKEGGEGH